MSDKETKLPAAPDNSPPCRNCGYGISQHDAKNGWCFNGGHGEDASQYEAPTPTPKRSDSERLDLLDNCCRAIALHSMGGPEGTNKVFRWQVDLVGAASLRPSVREAIDATFAELPTSPPPSETAKMTQYRKSIVVEAITFDELIEHGKAQGVAVYDGYPWSFSYRGYPITHENNDCYLVITPQGTKRFNRGEMLIVDENGRLSTELPGSFEANYEPVDAKD